MLNRTQINTLKNRIFNELEKVSEDNSKLRYTKCNIPVHYDNFENVESKLGWYIYWGESIDEKLDESEYEIRPMINRKFKSDAPLIKMLDVLDNPKHEKSKLSNSVAAAITDINGNVISVDRNIKNDKSKSKENHAEQLAIENLKKLQLPISKLKIYVTTIPCIDCFKKIYATEEIDEIIYLKDYRTTLVLLEHQEFTKNVKNKKKYSIRTKSIKNDISRRICYHHDAYLIMRRVTDILDKNWFKELNGERCEIQISDLTYADFEKISVLMKYMDKGSVSLNAKNGSIVINKDKFKKELKDLVKLYKGDGKGNKLVNKLEELNKIL